MQRNMACYFQLDTLNEALVYWTNTTEFTILTMEAPVSKGRYSPFLQVLFLLWYPVSLA